MRESIVANRYAGALFSLAGKEGKRDAHGRELSRLSEMIAGHPGLAQTLKSPLISPAEKKAVMGELLARMECGQTMRNFCSLLADKERLAELPAIAACYGRLLDEANGILRGAVTTAVALDENRRKALKEKLKNKLGRDIEVTFHIDPEILGGMVLTVGDKVVDSSLRAQLGTLREILIRGI